MDRRALFLLTGLLDSLYRRFELGCFRLWLWWFVGCCGSFQDFICSQSEVSCGSIRYQAVSQGTSGAQSGTMWMQMVHHWVAGSLPLKKSYASLKNSSSSNSSSNPIEQFVPGLERTCTLRETFRPEVRANLSDPASSAGAAGIFMLPIIGIAVCRSCLNNCPVVLVLLAKSLKCDTT